MPHWAHRLVAELQVALDLGEAFLGVAAVRVAVDQHAVAAAAAQELVERHAGGLGLEVPKCRVDRRDRRHGDGPAPPISALRKVLPDVLAAARVAPDEAGNDVVAEIGGDRKLAPVERGIAEPVKPLLGHDLERDEVAPGTADDDARFPDLHDILLSGSAIMMGRIVKLLTTETRRARRREARLNAEVAADARSTQRRNTPPCALCASSTSSAVESCFFSLPSVSPW